jgi:alpha-L-fucosidase
MNVNGEAIYGTTASPFGRFPWGRSTVKLRDDGATVYLHVFDWPEDGKLSVSGFGSVPDSVVLLDGYVPLTHTRFAESAGKGIIIDVPAEPGNHHASVIQIEVNRALDFEKVRPGQQTDGRLTLEPNEAYFHSNSKNPLRVEINDRQENIGNWSQDKSWIYWEFRISQPGTFKLTTEIAAVKDVGFTYQLKDIKKSKAPSATDDEHQIYAADEFAPLPGYEKIEVAIPATGSEEKFVSVELGTLEITKPGVYVLEIRPVKNQWASTRMRAITLKPAGNP